MPVFIGEEILPTGLTFEGTEVGGLSGLAYDGELDVYYAISDDRSQLQPARYYTRQIDLSDGAVDDSDVSILDVTTLRDHRADTTAHPDHHLRGRRLAAPPFVREFGLTGRDVDDDEPSAVAAL